MVRWMAGTIPTRARGKNAVANQLQIPNSPALSLFLILVDTMVQGKTKGLQNKSSSSSRHAAKSAANTKKGKKYIAPKKPILMKQASMQKVTIPFLLLG